MPTMPSRQELRDIAAAINEYMDYDAENPKRVRVKKSTETDELYDEICATVSALLKSNFGGKGVKLAPAEILAFAGENDLVPTKKAAKPVEPEEEDDEDEPAPKKAKAASKKPVEVDEDEGEDIVGEEDDVRNEGFSEPEDDFDNDEPAPTPAKKAKASAAPKASVDGLQLDLLSNPNMDQIQEYVMQLLSAVAKGAQITLTIASTGIGTPVTEKPSKKKVEVEADDEIDSEDEDEDAPRPAKKAPKKAAPKEDDDLKELTSRLRTGDLKERRAREKYIKANEIEFEGKLSQYTERELSSLITRFEKKRKK